MMNKVITIDCWQDLNMEQILDIDDNSLKKEILMHYNEAIKSLSNSPESKLYIDPHKSISEIYNDILMDEYKNSSNNLFIGDKVTFYPRIKTLKARTKHICHFSGATINIGNKYLSYRPLIYNISTGDSYVLSKTITCEEAYYYELPKDLCDFEIMISNLENSFELNNEWYSFSCNYGNDTLSLKKLKKTQK